MYSESDSAVIELKNTALRNKKHIKYKTILAAIDDKNISFKIMGVGQKSIRLDVYFRYEDILENSDGSIESMLLQMINNVYD